MSHGMTNELGDCLDVRDDNLEKKYYFHMFPINF